MVMGSFRASIFACSVKYRAESNNLKQYDCNHGLPPNGFDLRTDTKGYTFYCNLYEFLRYDNAAIPVGYGVG